MYKNTLIVLLGLVFLLSACAPAAATPEAMLEKPTQVMETAGEAMQDKPTDAMAGAATEAMDSPSEDMMKTPAGDMSGSHSDAATGTPEAMSDSMMATAATPDAMSDSMMAAPAWFSATLNNVRTGEDFSINDFKGKVVLVETLAMWCPNCVVQANEVRELHKLLDKPEDLVSVSLDVDVNEDAAMLKEYASKYGFDWRFAVAPLEVARALGNLYTAQYLNPPLSPMLVIDRQGNVHHLEYGLKKAEALQKFLEPYLAE